MTDQRPESHGSSDSKLFTPGPLTTSASVKHAMLHDIGAWDAPLRALVEEIRSGLLDAAGTSKEAGWECVLMQGSGSFGVESAIASLTPRDARLAVVANGAYGERMITMGEMLGIDVVPMRFPEDRVPSASDIDAMLAADPTIHTVAIVHCETTTGLLNDVAAVGEVVRGRRRRLLIDAMSSFGAYALDLEALGCDVLISGANKCIEGVPGFSFVFARRDLLVEAERGTWPRSHSLDLVDQWKAFEASGKFRFTPPTQVLLAFAQALREFRAEGGVSAREKRYRANHGALLEGMRRLGFTPFVAPDAQSHIITTFHCPADDAFEFVEFYDRLTERGLVIYPGKVTGSQCFRIGNIGQLFPSDMEHLVAAIEAVSTEMGFDPAARLAKHEKAPPSPPPSH
jgi:2-aminoethylphosphonate-pyruvate transaminase